MLAGADVMPGTDGHYSKLPVMVSPPWSPSSLLPAPMSVQNTARRLQELVKLVM